jgi:rhodanese-related sulfurtransferase
LVTQNFPVVTPALATLHRRIQAGQGYPEKLKRNRGFRVYIWWVMDLTTFVIKNWYLFVALGVVLGLLAVDPLRRIIYKLKYVSPMEAVNLINRENAVVVDIRDAAEFRTGHIVGALDIPYADLKTRAAELDKHKSRPIIVVDRNGQGAGKAAVVFRKRGLADVRVLAGGVAAWLRAQFPVEK